MRQDHPQNAKVVTRTLPNANTALVARARQDPRNGKIDPLGPDKIGTTTRTTPTGRIRCTPGAEPSLASRMQQDLPQLSENDPASVEPWTLRPTPNPGTQA